MTTAFPSPAAFPTPVTVVDEAVLDANIAAMAARAAAAGLTLRPHVKTHKSVEIARRQLAAGAIGLTVATIGEAEVFVRAGFDDIFLAYPLWLTPESAARLRALQTTATIALGCDSIESGRHTAALLPGARVLIEVDSGHHRTGVDPAEAGTVAAALVAAGLDVHGLFTFPGHSYAPGEAAAAATTEIAALTEAAGVLRAHGVEPQVLSGGSTPSAAFLQESPLTELRPGVYVFHDAQQWELGTCGPRDISFTVHATVVSRRPGRDGPGRVVLDAGSKVLGADRSPWATGGGRLLDEPEARIVQLSEHHAVAQWPGDQLPELGSRVRVVPNHVCNAVNLVEQLVPVRDGLAGPPWPVDARGANG